GAQPFLTGGEEFIRNHVARESLAQGRRACVASDTMSTGRPVQEVAALPTAAVSLDKVKTMLEPDWLCQPFLRGLDVATAIRWQDGLRPTCRWSMPVRWQAPTAFASL